MGNLAGYQGNRPLQEFSRRYGHDIMKLLGIEVTLLPSYSTFRRFHPDLDFMVFSAAFASGCSKRWRREMTHMMSMASPLLNPSWVVTAKLALRDGECIFSAKGVSVDLAILTCEENREKRVRSEQRMPCWHFGDHMQLTIVGSILRLAFKRWRGVRLRCWNGKSGVSARMSRLRIRSLSHGYLLTGLARMAQVAIALRECPVNAQQLQALLTQLQPIDLQDDKPNTEPTSEIQHQ